MKSKQISIAFCLLFFFSLVWTTQTGITQENAPAPAPEVIPDITEEAVTLPEGTIIPIVLNDYLNTRNSQAGDVFYADTTYPIWVNQKLIVPKGSNVRGTVTEVVRPGRIRGKGRMTVRFDDILLPNGVRHPLAATFRGIHGPGEETLDRNAESVEGTSSTSEDMGTVIGTTTAGAVLGSVIGIAGDSRSTTGTAIGAGVGAATGIAMILFTRGRDLVINPGTRFDLELRQSMKFARNELEFSSSQIDDAGRNLQMSPVAAPTSSPSKNSRQWPQRGRGILGIPGGVF